MSNSRHIILSWAEQGRLSAPELSRALALVGVLPSREAWRHFLDRLLLWMGTVLIAAGLIFFLAYNWDDLGRLARFSLVQALLVAALLLVWRLGLDRAGGKATLFAACLFLGALLALIGQTYQTGADTFELFATWAVMILPWVLVGRFAVLWLLWLTLVNLAIILYFQAFPGIFGVLFGTGRVLWLLFAFNTVALAVWEALAASGIGWLGGRWGPRLVATAGGAVISALAMMQILDVNNSSDVSGWAVPAWLAWLAAVWAVYRRPVKDVYVLAGGVLSVVVVVTAFSIRHLLSYDDAGGYLMAGLIVIALSAAGGWWLRNLAAEEDAP